MIQLVDPFWCGRRWEPELRPVRGWCRIFTPRRSASLSKRQPNSRTPTAVQHGAFFNYEQAATIAAFTERLMPGAPGKPGASDAGVLNYIDLALSGAYADLQDFYRSGLAQLDAYCRKTYNEPFVQLDASRAGRSDCRTRAGEGG